MSLSGVSLDQSATSSPLRSTIREARKDFDQLFQALKSGDLNAAQQAYASFQQIQAGLASSSPTQAAGTTATAATSATAATNPVASDWSALGQALQSGSLASAQDAFGKVEQDAQAAWQTHVQQETQNAQSVYALMQSVQGNATPAAAVATSAAAGAQSLSSSVQNDLNALNQSLQTGDTSAAQKLLAQLVQDMQSAQNSLTQNGGSHHHHHHHGGPSGMNAASSYGSAATATTSTTASTTTASATTTAAATA